MKRKPSAAASAPRGWLLILLVVAPVVTQHAALPCNFNSMCSCKTNSALRQASPAHDDDVADYVDPPIDQPTSHLDREDDEEEEDEEDVGDVSCVAVPFALLPALPAGRIAHVDIVNSGLQVASDSIAGGSAAKFLSSASPHQQHRTARIESLRLMSNRICHVADHLFRGMEEDLKSLDLSYNELDELPVRAMSQLQVLDWANFHSNQIAHLDGLGPLWNQLSPTLHALFLGNNDLLALPKSNQPPPPTTADDDDDASGMTRRRTSSDGSSSLANLRHLHWLNVDGNQLSQLTADALPVHSLHTLSAAHNRITRFPTDCVQQLHQLRWLDLRGNFIQHLPVSTIRTGDPSATNNNKLRLEKLDLGENLIAALPEDGALFNRSLVVRDLYLDFNRIGHLPEAPFRGTNVARLYLAANGMSHINERAFHSLSSTLVLLDLERNKLSKYPSDALRHLKKLRFLYLAGNRIGRLAANDLATFGPELEALTLADNFLMEFPSAAFKFAPKLAHLNLGHNGIRNLSSDMFLHWADHLQVLILKGNQIGELPSRLFRHATHLRELNLSFNKLVAIGDDALIDLEDQLETLELNMALERIPFFPSGLLRPLRHLHWLSLEHNKISSLPSSALDHLPKLRYVSLDGNRLTSIGAGHFKSGRLRSLRDVRLSYNQLESIGPRTFHNLAQLTTIVLSYNRIQTVHHSAFDHLTKLITLNLANNRIERLEGHAFRSLPNLLQLDLSSNRLRHFGWDAMANCSTNRFMAATLNLSDNHLSSLELTTTSDAARINIKTLDLSDNMLSVFPEPAFLSGLVVDSLRRLLLANNRIGPVLTNATMRTPALRRLEVLDLKSNAIEELQVAALDGASYLQVLDLSGNQLEQLPPASLAHLKRLRVVDLSNNKLRSLPKNLFSIDSDRNGRTTPPVETLRLTGNQLTTLPGCLPSISTTLAHLDASRNQIEHIDGVMLSTVPNLVHLNLAHNRLTLLSDNVFSHLSSLVSLDLSYNTIRANFKELFHEIQHVKELHLAGVGLQRWPHLPLPNLIQLNLSANGLDYRSLDAGPPGSSGGKNLVIRLDKLRKLDLSRNRLALVPSFLWPSTPLLKQLDLSSNPIRQLNRESFAHLVRLQVLDLQPLPVLETIDADAFHSLIYLSELRMQTWAGPHLSQLLGGLRGLRKLNVEVRGPVLSSQLNYVANLETAPKLSELLISGPLLKTVHADVLANTGIHTLPECTLSLKSTALKTLPEQLINGLEGCASLTLDLRSNALQTLASSSVSSNNVTNSFSMSSTRHLSGGLWLDQNPWVCSCENAWMAQWLKRWHLESNAVRHPVSSLPLSQVACRDPISSKKRPIVELPDNAACSAADSRLTTTTTLLILFASFLLLIF